MCCLCPLGGAYAHAHTSSMIWTGWVIIIRGRRRRKWRCWAASSGMTLGRGYREMVQELELESATCIWSNYIHVQSYQRRSGNLKYERRETTAMPEWHWQAAPSLDAPGKENLPMKHRLLLTSMEVSMSLLSRHPDLSSHWHPPPEGIKPVLAFVSFHWGGCCLPEPSRLPMEGLFIRQPANLASVPPHFRLSVSYKHPCKDMFFLGSFCLLFPTL